MSKITEIPSELLDNILELADEPFVHAKVCRVFNLIATPILYRTVKCASHRFLKPHNIHRFLRCITSRPALGNLVRRLIVVLYGPATRAELLPSFVAEAGSHGFPPEAQRAVADGSIMVMLFLLLHYLPRLQELVVHLPMGDPDYWILYQQMLTTSPLPLALQSIRSVELFSLAQGEYTLEMVMPFLRLPALQRFAMHGLFKYNDSKLIDEPLPGSSLIEHMAFYSCDFDGAALGALVRWSQSLRRFVYHTTTFKFHPLFLGDALRQGALDTLQHLEVEHTGSLVGCFGPLSDFTSLTYIQTSLSLLLGTPDGSTVDTIARRLSAALPVSLISLRLSVNLPWEGAMVVLAMELFVKNRRDRLKHLRKLGFRGPYENIELRRFESLCKAEGLEVLSYAFRGRTLP